MSNLDTKFPYRFGYLKDSKLSFTPLECAWLAGLLEGEGSFSLDRRGDEENGRAPRNPTLSLSMTDQDVIEKAAALLKREPLRLALRPNRLQVWRVTLNSRNDLLYVITVLFPHFGIRRQQQCLEVLESLKRYEIWRENGGPSQMARLGVVARLNKRNPTTENK